MARPTVPLYTGDVPQRGQNETDFTNNMNDYVLWQDSMVSQVVDLSVWFESEGNTAQQVLAEANTASDMALAAVNFVGRWTDQSGALATGKSVSHDGLIWVAEQDIADVTLSEPAFDNPDWITISGNYVEDRTTNVSLRVYDIGKILYLNGDFTQTIEDIDLLPVGWFTYLRNVGSSVITVDPFEAQTVDGDESFDLAPGQTFMVVRDETEFRRIHMVGEFVEEHTASTNIAPRTEYQYVKVELWSGGNGGGSGSAAAGGTGGEYVCEVIALADLPAPPISLVIGDGGTGAAPDAGSGDAGGDTSFGSVLSAKAAPKPSGVQNITFPRSPVNMPSSTDTAINMPTMWSYGMGGSANTNARGGGSSVKGGGGGGASGSTARNPAGTSETAGDGGNGSETANGENGHFPSGGGGAATESFSGGDGAPGKARLTWF